MIRVKSDDRLFAERIVKIQISSDLKSRIAGCQKSCASLKDSFYNRIHLDTNVQVDKISMFLLAWRWFLSELTLADIERTLDAIKDDTLGTFEFLFSWVFKKNSSNSPAGKIKNWLSPPDSSKNRHEADEKRQVDTCSWFLDGERFLEWQENPGFLWIKGKGKFLSKLFEFEY